MTVEDAELKLVLDILCWLLFGGWTTYPLVAVVRLPATMIGNVDENFILGLASFCLFSRKLLFQTKSENWIPVYCNLEPFRVKLG